MGNLFKSQRACNCKVGDHEVRFLVNTGAALSLLNVTLKGSKTEDRVIIHGVGEEQEERKIQVNSYL